MLPIGADTSFDPPLYLRYVEAVQAQLAALPAGTAVVTCDEGFVNCRFIPDRKITGFQATSDFTTVVTSTLGDGPDCGKTGTFPGHPEWGNRYRPCLGASQSLYWRKLEK